MSGARSKKPRALTLKDAFETEFARREMERRAREEAERKQQEQDLADAKALHAAVSADGDFLKKRGVRHVLLVGYATDMCYCRTTAGYQNLAKDFNVFLVGDATLATFPANATPRFATNAHVSFAAINQLVTQVNWVVLR